MYCACAVFVSIKSVFYPIRYCSDIYRFDEDDCKVAKVRMRYTMYKDFNFLCSGFLFFVFNSVQGKI